MNAASRSNRFDHVEVDHGAVNRNRLEPGGGASVLLAGDNHVFINGRVATIRRCCPTAFPRLSRRTGFLTCARTTSPPRQRLYSSRAGTDVTDFETGFYAIIPTTSEGDPLPRPAPTIRDMNRQGGFSGENFRIGRRSLSTAEPFRGEIAEMIAFSGDLTGAPREQILRYLQRKYGIVERPMVDLSADETVEPLRVFVGGEEALWVRRQADGSLRFAAPPHTGEEPLPVSADVTVRRADGAEAVFADGSDGNAPLDGFLGRHRCRVHPPRRRLDGTQRLPHWRTPIRRGDFSGSR